LTEQIVAPGMKPAEVLALAASVERYSKHPLAQPIVSAAQSAALAFHEASQISERPGEGLRGIVAGRPVEITSRTQLLKRLRERRQHCRKLRAAWSAR